MGSAAQLAQALGLHRRTCQRSIDPITKEQRNRLFWVSYVMANNISMLVGRPSPIQDFDCDVDLPLDVDDNQITHEGIITTRSHRPFNFFLNDIRLSKIVSKVYNRLYSAHALAHHTWDSLADTIGELDAELIQWRDAIPLEYRPEQEISWHDNATYRHVMLTHLTYYNCMYTIHRPVFTLALRSGSSFAPDKPVKELRNARVYGSAAVCVGASRSGLRLVLDVAQRFPGIVGTKSWYSPYFPY
jgi:Fungal specific transcription factor domain